MLLNAFADHLDELARRTWFNVTEAKRLGMRMGEVTITEANLLSIAQFIATTGLSAELVPTKADEAVTGADFEIWFDIGGAVLGYTFQAKVLMVGSRTFSYPGIGKKDKTGTEQSELLEHQAIAVGAFPFHVLFNGWDAGLAGAPTLPSGWPARHFGCAAIATPEVRRIRSSRSTRRPVKAGHFLPSSFPWSHLFRLASSTAPSAPGGSTAIGDTGAGGSRGAGHEILPGDPVDIEALAQLARQLMVGHHHDFGSATNLPEYVRQTLEGEPGSVEQGQYAPKFAIVIRRG
ncbi:hypothetical protein ABLE92_22205 [Gordonia sp. VNQ95]|uniref:hypothetical protein n=1 Tax=Gordonia sp. VNQ95 TaxID=3156619 RepID=UPI0032B33AEB